MSLVFGPSGVGCRMSRPILFFSCCLPPPVGEHQPSADKRGDEDDAQDDARDGALGLDGRLVGGEHEAAVGVGGDGGEGRLAVQILSGVGEEQPQKPALHQVARALPEADVRLGDGADAARRDVRVHLPDARRHLGEMLLEAKAFDAWEEMLREYDIRVL